VLSSKFKKKGKERKKREKPDRKKGRLTEEKTLGRKSMKTVRYDIVFHSPLDRNARVVLLISIIIIFIF